MHAAYKEYLMKCKTGLRKPEKSRIETFDTEVEELKREIAAKRPQKDGLDRVAFHSSYPRNIEWYGGQTRADWCLFGISGEKKPFCRNTVTYIDPYRSKNLSVRSHYDGARALPMSGAGLLARQTTG
jgi:hypothetical protein